MMGGIFGTRAFVAKHTSRSLPLSRSPSNQQSIICRGFPRGSPGAISLRSAHHPEGPPGRAASRDALRPARPDQRSSRSHLARGQVGRARGGSREEGTVRFVVGRRGVAGWIARRRGRLARRRRAEGGRRGKPRARLSTPARALPGRRDGGERAPREARVELQPGLRRAHARGGGAGRCVREPRRGARALACFLLLPRDRGRARPPPPPASPSRARAAIAPPAPRGARSAPPTP